nr:class I SAM-dependent methyltransferase [Deltaproteobacteria bacterium]
MEVKQAKSLISSLFVNGSSVSGRVRFWDGSEISFGREAPAFVIHFKTPEALDALWGNLSMGFGEAYTRGDIDVDGDLGEVVSLAYKEGLFSKFSPMQKIHLCWLNLRKKASLKQSKLDIQAHYDRGNFFYRLWLDKGLNYSCAYFNSTDDSLERAQMQKIHHSLKKLRLKPGQRLLDIGCGWGSLVAEAARSYGVKAVGLTLAENQYELGCRRIEKEGLSDEAEIRLQDYREIPDEENGIYDRIVSIGMFEHVGKENIQIFFEKVAKLLRPKGILLLHTIARLKPEPLDPWLKKYIFPNGYIPALGETVEAAQDVGLDFSDLEDLRLHYDLTLGHWIERFEANALQVRRMMGKQFVRMWRLYLHGSQRSFRHNRLHVFQLLYSMGCRKDWPLARDKLTATSAVTDYSGLLHFPSHCELR